MWFWYLSDRRLKQIIDVVTFCAQTTLPAYVTLADRVVLCPSFHKNNGHASQKWFSVLTLCGSPFMRLAEHLTALGARCLRLLAWSVKTRRAPSRHCSNARVNGHKTTDMHMMSTPPSLEYRTPRKKSETLVQAGFVV